MRWTERQRQLLAGMGIRLWPDGVDAAGDAPAAGSPAAAGLAVAERAPAVAEAPPPAPARPASPPAGRPAAGRPPRDASPPDAARPAAPPPVAATAVDARGLGWPELQAAVASCTACALCHSRTQTVFGTGHPRAHWMIVGEAPGEQEDRQGEPFVGRSGQLLDHMLRAVKLSRAAVDAAGAPTDPARSVFIANTLKCRPPGNRNPTLEEMQRCEGFLVRQVELVQPKIILAMGKFAVQALLRSNEPIGRLRGRVHHYQGVPLIVTFHPAYLLRSPSEKARAWEDFCLALDTLEAAP